MKSMLKINNLIQGWRLRGLCVLLVLVGLPLQAWAVKPTVPISLTLNLVEEEELLRVETTITALADMSQLVLKVLPPSGAAFAKGDAIFRSDMSKGESKTLTSWYRIQSRQGATHWRAFANALIAGVRMGKMASNDLISLNAAAGQKTNAFRVRAGAEEYPGN